MLRTMLAGKIHRATVTQVDLNYEGSITIDETLLESAGMLPYEWVQVLNINTGGRFETYAIPGERDSGVVGLNGAAARLGMTGDLLIVLAYRQCDEAEARAIKPAIVFVDRKNHVTEWQRGSFQTP
jgi:aspartate 1-decarboxylase